MPRSLPLVTPTMRFKTRFQRAGLSTTAFFIDRGVKVAIALVRVPLYLHALGVEDYGVLLVIGSVIGWTAVAESGMNAGVVNGVAEAAGSGVPGRIRAVVSTAVALYSTIAVGLVVLILPALWIVPLPELLGLHESYSVLVRLWLVLGVGAYCASLPLRAVTSAVVGHQELYLVTFLGTLQEVISLAGVYAVLYFTRTGLEGLALWQSLFPLLWLLLTIAWIVRVWRKELLPAWSAIDRTIAKRLFAVSGSFYWIQLGMLLLWSVDNIVISSYLGPGAVPRYSVAFQMFFMGMQLATALSSSLWAGVGDAAAKDDWAWIQKAYGRGQATALGIATALAVLGASFGTEALTLWAGRDVAAGPQLLSVFALWLIAQAWTSSHSILLGALTKLRTIAWAVPLEAGVNLGLSVVLVRHFGIFGVALGTLLGHLLVSVWLMPREVSRQFVGRVTVQYRPLAAALAGGASSAAAAAVIRWALGPPRTLASLLMDCAGTALVFVCVYTMICFRTDQRRALAVRLSRRIGLPLLSRPAVKE